MATNGGSFRAVILATTLVVATTAGAATFSGTVVADAQDLTVTNEANTVQPGGNLTFEVTDDVSAEERDIHVWIDENGNAEFDRFERHQTYNSSRASTISGTFRDVDFSPGGGPYTVMAVENDTLEESQTPQTWDNFTVDDSPPVVDNAVAFTETGETQAHGDSGTTVVEVIFNERLSDGTDGTAPAPGDVLVELTNGRVLNATLTDGGTGDRQGDRRVVLHLGDDVGPSDVASVTVATRARFTDTAGNTVSAHSNSVQSATTTIAEGGENRTAFRGEAVAIVGDGDAEEIYMRSTTGDIVFDETTGPDSKVFAWDSAGWATDRDYRIFFDGRTHPNFLLAEDVSLGLKKLGLTVTPTRTHLQPDEALNVTVRTNPPNRTVEATLRENGTVVADRTATLDGNETTVNFGQQDTGDYTIEVEDSETGLTAGAGPIRVRERTSDSTTPRPTPSRTPTPTYTHTPTPSSDRVQTVAATVTPTPPRTTRPSKDQDSTAGTSGTPYPMVTPPEQGTATATQTPTATPTLPKSSQPVPTSTPSTSPSEAPGGLIEILQLMWDGATDAVGAVSNAIVDFVGGLLP